MHVAVFLVSSLHIIVHYWNGIALERSLRHFVDNLSNCPFSFFFAMRHFLHLAHDPILTDSVYEVTRVLFPQFKVTLCQVWRIKIALWHQYPKFEHLIIKYRLAKYSY